MTFLAVTRAPSWDDVVASLGSKALIAFRGQTDAAWTLETTLYREALRKPTDITAALASRESWLLYQFGRYAHQLIPDLPPKENLLDWLALIQHYGGPTRLLDFTYSLFVAAFFAIETAASDAAIWMISLPRLNAATQARLGFHEDGRIDAVRCAHNKRFEECVRSQSDVATVTHVEPDRVHERLWVQQGLFLAPINLKLPFMNNLAGTFGQAIDPLPSADLSWEEFVNDIYRPNGYVVGKIVLPKEMHEEIRHSLRAVNINAATLFPGLEGFARSLRFHV